MVVFTPELPNLQYGLIDHPIERCDIYYPDRDVYLKPAAGWTLVAIPRLLGFTATSKPTQFSDPDALEHMLLSAGIAVATAYLPVARGGATSNADNDGSVFDPEGGTPKHAAAYRWNGVSHPMAAYTQPSGLTPSPAWDQEDYLAGPISAVRLMRFLRSNAATYELNPNELWAWGQDAAGYAVAHAFFADDSDGIPGAGYTGTSGRPNGLGLADAPLWTRALVQDADPPAGFQHPVNDVGAPFDWDQPAATLDQSTVAIQVTASPAFLATDEVEFPGIRALNAARAARAWAGYATASAAALTAPGGSATRYGLANRDDSLGWTAAVDEATELGDAYFGYLLKSVFPAARLVVSAAAQDSDPVAGGGVAEDAVIDDATLRRVDFVNFLLAAAGQPEAGYEVFDLGSEEPAPRSSDRTAAQAGDARGPRFARTLDARQIRRYPRELRSATRADIQRLVDLWARTRSGTLPMIFHHEDDGQLLVVFDDERLEWRQESAVGASFTVTLREWPGG